MNDSGLADVQQWKTLDSATDASWQTDVIETLLKIVADGISTPPDKLLEATRGWLSGL